MEVQKSGACGHQQKGKEGVGGKSSEWNGGCKGQEDLVWHAALCVYV